MNTAVTTSISASPSPSYLDDSDEQDSPALSAPGTDDDDDVPHEEVDQVEVEDAEDEDDDDDIYNRISIDDHYGRKPSIVSVSTTISTMTESISPQPTTTHDFAHASDSPLTVNHHGDSSPSAAVMRLGPPPLLRSLLLLAEMSSEGNLMTGAYTSQCVIEARKFPEFVMGFIAQRSLNELPEDNFVTMTPGVQIGSTGDGLGQQYNTPEKVIADAGTDIIIVGRGIYGAFDKRAMAEEYRSRAWAAYEARLAPGAKRSFR